ncbi:MAG: ABC transporter ATP-binding protein [Clostridiaceae bacterium]|jgi:branched-chain amino acid transport system ATP-binding protein|nr:ABC transporter ATP-binding protein [Clostridiaceae bacterium]
MLELNAVNGGYGVLKILKDIDITINDGEIVTLIGNNGAGKTTTLKAICGLVHVTGGTISFQGENITNKASHLIPAMGIRMVPEGRHIFSKLTVRENLNMGAYLTTDKSMVAEDLEKVFSLFPTLKERQKQKGGSLSGGEQQMLAIGRALMGRPRLLLLDEPSMGLAPILVEKIFMNIVEINKLGTTIFLVEQNAKLALEIANRGYVIETGKIVISGTNKELISDENVKKAYLGESD